MSDLIIPFVPIAENHLNNEEEAEDNPRLYPSSSS